jgi:hypothetical protein
MRICAIEAQLGLVSVVKLIYKNFHKDHSVDRLALLFAFCFAFGAIGAQRASAQAAPLDVAKPLERAKAGEPGPQALFPAQPPVPADPPGFIPHASAATTPTSRPKAGTKTSSVTQPAHPIVPGSNQTAKQPEQTKVAQIYRGEGYFDIALAEKLRPVFTKNSSEPAPSNKGLAPVDLVRAILGGGDSSQKSADQKTVAETGRP